jgi:hypothetical protein
MSGCLGAACPACGAIFIEDEWEVLLEKVVHSIACHACRSVVHASWFECEACVAENLIASLSAQDCLDRTCKQCGHTPDDAGVS